MSNSKEKFLSLAIFLVVWLIYLAVPTRNYYWDGIEFAKKIEAVNSLSPILFHSNHLIYNAFGYLLYQFALDLGWNSRAIEILQIANAFLGALCAALLFFTLNRCLRSNYLAFFLTLLFAFSATWWKFSTDANAYIPAVLFILASFYLVLPGKKASPLFVALLHSISMYFHQLAVFCVPVLMLGIFLQTAALTPSRRFRIVFSYLGVAFTLTFGAYLLGFYLLTGSLDDREFARWLLWYSPETGFVFNFENSLRMTFRGHARLFFDGRFNFVKEVINPLSIALICLLATAVALLIVKFLQKSKRYILQRNSAQAFAYNSKQIIYLCLVWCLPYLVFLFFFIPQNTFYRLFYLPALIILIGVFLRKREILAGNKRKWRVALLVIIAFCANFLFFIYPYSRVRNNTPLALAFQMNNVWTNKTTVYFVFQNSDNHLLHYFNPQTKWKKLETVTTPEFEAEIKRIYAEGGTAWLETSALEHLKQTEEGKLWLARHGSEQIHYELTDPAYNLRLVQIMSEN